MRWIKNKLIGLVFFTNFWMWARGGVGKKNIIGLVT